MSLHQFAVIAALLVTSPTLAQSVVTLDDLDLFVSDSTDTMRDCLFAADKACSDEEYGGSTEITLDDVINLGVVDKSEIPSAATSTAAALDPLPSIDLEIRFAYDSDDLTEAAYIKLASLARVMDDPRLKGRRLVFIGHTDAVGSQAYNLELSRRRAEAVADYVRAITGMAPVQIAAVGVGFRELKNSFDPTAPENRRVQLVLVPIS